MSQFFVSTDDDEKKYFTGQKQFSGYPLQQAVFPAGIYRVIHGELYQIMDTDDFALTHFVKPLQ